MILLTLLGISPYSLSYNASHSAIGPFLYGFPSFKSLDLQKKTRAHAVVNRFLGYAGISTVCWTWSKQDGMSKIDAHTLRLSRPNRTTMAWPTHSIDVTAAFTESLRCEAAANMYTG